MKRIIAVCLVLSMLFVPALAEVDLSGMSYDDLVALKDQINIAMWESEEWQEVTVPQGVWEVGKDIPAGHWTFKPSAGHYANVRIGSRLNEDKKSIDWRRSEIYYLQLIKSETAYEYDPTKDINACDYVLTEGLYVQIEYASVIFTPYSGKPSLGFK